MSRPKHTAAPWRVDETKALGAYGVWTDYATHPGHDGAGYPSQICSVIHGFSNTAREERDANARLIAAAPDLLAACKLRLGDHQCAQRCDGPHDDCPCWYCVTCRAIKKAEGAA